MRYSDPRLTMQLYTDSGVFKLRAALETLEPLKPGICVPICVVGGVQKGAKESFSVRDDATEDNAQVAGNDGEVLKCPEDSEGKIGSGGWTAGQNLVPASFSQLEQVLNFEAFVSRFVR